MLEARQRLERLTWLGVALPEIDAGIFNTLEREEPSFVRMIRGISRNEINFRALESRAVGDISFEELIRIGTYLLPTPLREALSCLTPTTELSPDDVTILAVFETVPGEDPETVLRRGRKRARYQIWEPSPTEFDDRLARLQPVIDAIIQKRCS